MERPFLVCAFFCAKRSLIDHFNAATIEAYEGGELDYLYRVLHASAKLADIPVENLTHDDRDLWFGHRVN